ncbi:MAG: hypothetical protein AAFO07_00485 [Bacteroidota bacterium]
MQSKQFFIQLFAVTIATGLILFFLNNRDTFRPDAIFSWGGLAFFFLLSMVMFIVGNKAAHSSNKNKLVNTILGFTVLKLFVTFAAILAYYLLTEPETKFFVIPFIIVYLVYTIFETSFMMKLSKVA